MALDPSISLGYRPPQIQPLHIQSPLERYAKLMTLRGMMEQQQLRGFQIQEAQAEAEQRRQALEAERQFRALYADPNAMPTRSQIYGTLGPKGATVIKTQAEIDEQDIKTRATKAARLGSVAGSILDGPTQDAETLRRGVMRAVNEKLLDPQEGEQIIARGWTPETSAQLRQFQIDALTGAQQLEQKIRDAEEARKAAKAPFEQRAVAAGATKTEQEAAGTQPITPQQKAESERQVWTTPGGLTAIINDPSRSPADKERAQAQLNLLAGYQTSIAAARRAPGAGGQYDESLAATVIENPSLWDNLTPTAKTRIAPLLSENGFTQFGKPLAESAMTKIAESRSAIESLKDLRQTLKDNEQYIGPISGLQALNPYSEARQAQAKIDLVKQRVGKALEGGVLRKEDEEKYKRILATLRDTPATAIAKVDNLLTTLERDIKLFEEQQRRGGRNVPEAPAEQPPPGKSTVKMRAPNGQTSDVPADQVEHYKSRGAVVVGK